MSKHKICMPVDVSATVSYDRQRCNVSELSNKPNAGEIPSCVRHGARARGVQIIAPPQLLTAHHSYATARKCLTRLYSAMRHSTLYQVTKSSVHSELQPLPLHLSVPYLGNYAFRDTVPSTGLQCTPGAQRQPNR